MNPNKVFLKLNQDLAFSKFMMRGKKSKSIFFPGCSFMKFGNGMIYKTLDLLKMEDDEIEVCSLCCGYPSQVLDKNYYKKNRDKIVSFLNEREVKKIYVACPNCYNMLDKLKKEYNLNFSIIMIYRIINEKLSHIKNYHNINKKVVIHDPCMIKNDEETQNSIRNILDKIGQEYTEPQNTKTKTMCCGNINMTHVLNKDLAYKVCSKRVDELRKEADIILSYCNGCLYAFKKCNINTIHIMELVFGKVDKDIFYKRIKFTRGLKKC